MPLTYYHSSEIGPHISVTFPPQTPVISRATKPHSSFSYFHPLTLFFLSHSLTQLLFLPTLALFWVSALGYFMLSVPPASLRLSFSPRFAILRFPCDSSPFFSLSFLKFMSHLIAIFHGLSLLLNCLCVPFSASSYTTSAYSFSSAEPFHLSLSVLALSRDPCPSFGSILFISFSFSILCLLMLSLSLYFSQRLCFVWHPADKAADKGEREHI